MMDEAMQDATLAEIIRRIVEVADPDRIILFGSRARGDARPDSDYDILVIGPSEESYYRRRVPVYQALWNLGAGKDVMWWTPSEVDKWRGLRSCVLGEALAEGVMVYERAA